MAKKTIPETRYNAFVRVSYEIVVPLDGHTFEDALASARLLKADDLVEFNSATDVNDSSLTLQGVHIQ